MEAHLKVPPPGETVQTARATLPGTQKKRLRCGERVSVSIAVVAYGWNRNHGSFHEETTTLLVNGGGGLVSLAAKVDLGETFFLMNKSTYEEEEVRVVYVQPDGDERRKVGLTFKRPNPEFWKRKRKKARFPKTLRVFVKGVDRNGNPFVQSAYTVDVSQSGARLDGVGYLTGLGETIEVRRFWRKARFRVVWIGEIGTPESNQIGIVCLEEGKNPLRSKVPISEKE